MNDRLFLNPFVTALSESPTLAINVKAKTLRAQGMSIYHFGFGQSPFPIHPKIQKALSDHAGEKDYLPTLGLFELRDSICQFLEKNFNYQFYPNHILVGPGSKELLFQATYILEGPVIVPAPSWVSYGPQVALRGKKIIPVITKRENSYKITPEELEEACLRNRAEQTILIINNPCNPTGAVYCPEEIEALSAVCYNYNVKVLSDEIYAFINFTNSDSKGFHNYYPEGTIVSGGLSKFFSAGGYRLGYLAIPKKMTDLLSALKSMVSETYSAVSSPIQYAAVAAFSGDPTIMDYVMQCTKIHKLTGEYLWTRFVAMGLNCPRPEGAFYLFPDFENFAKTFQKNGIQTSEALCDFLLEKYGIAALAGKDFYYPDEFLACRVASVDYNGEAVYEASLKADQLDFSFIERHCSNLKKGCDVLARCLNEHQSKKFVIPQSNVSDLIGYLPIHEPLPSF